MSGSRTPRRSLRSSTPRFVKALELRRDGDVFVLECLVDGHPKPEIRWEKEGRCVARSRRVHMTRCGGKCTLQIRSPQREDFGVYCCIASNIEGTTMAQLMVSEITSDTEKVNGCSGQARQPTITFGIRSRSVDRSSDSVKVYRTGQMDITPKLTNGISQVPSHSVVKSKLTSLTSHLWKKTDDKAYGAPERPRNKQTSSTGDKKQISKSVEDCRKDRKNILSRVKIFGANKTEPVPSVMITESVDELKTFNLSNKNLMQTIDKQASKNRFRLRQNILGTKDSDKNKSSRTLIDGMNMRTAKVMEVVDKKEAWVCGRDKVKERDSHCSNHESPLVVEKIEKEKTWVCGEDKKRLRTNDYITEERLGDQTKTSQLISKTNVVPQNRKEACKSRTDHKKTSPETLSEILTQEGTKTCGQENSKNTKISHCLIKYLPEGNLRLKSVLPKSKSATGKCKEDVSSDNADTLPKSVDKIFEKQNVWICGDTSKVDSISGCAIKGSSRNDADTEEFNIVDQYKVRSDNEFKCKSLPISEMVEKQSDWICGDRNKVKENESSVLGDNVAESSFLGHNIITTSDAKTVENGNQSPSKTGSKIASYLKFFESTATLSGSRIPLRRSLKEKTCNEKVSVPTRALSEREKRANDSNSSNLDKFHWKKFSDSKKRQSTNDTNVVTKHLEPNVLVESLVPNRVTIADNKKESTSKKCDIISTPSCDSEENKDLTTQVHNEITENGRNLQNLTVDEGEISDFHSKSTDIMQIKNEISGLGSIKPENDVFSTNKASVISEEDCTIHSVDTNLATRRKETLLDRSENANTVEAGSQVPTIFVHQPAEETEECDLPMSLEDVFITNGNTELSDRNGVINSLSLGKECQGKIRYSKPYIEEECEELVVDRDSPQPESIHLEVQRVSSPIECPARIVKGPQSVTVLRGESVTLAIYFTGCPQPNVLWMKGGRVLHGNHRLSILEGSEMSVVTVNEVTADDSGKYVVSVENEGGGDSCFASVAVVGFPEPPGGEPTASEVTDHSLVLSWYGSMYDGGSVVTGYQVEMCCLPDKKWQKVASSVNTSCSVQGLSKGQRYVFRVRAENKFGASHPSKESKIICLDDFLENSSEEEEPQELSAPVVVENGTLFSERFDLKEEVGKGRFGTVYRCVERSCGRPRAAKIIRCLKLKDKEKVRQEIEIMSRLRHPKLMQVLAAFENGRNMIMVMEYISGGELFERVIADDFVLTEQDCVLFMRQICDGVAYMHRNNILHLDLKPENILCKTRTSHKIKIIDFGLARVYTPNESLRVLFGTPEFVAPEVINYEPVTPASDMWSVGVICYVLLSGLSPFMGDSDTETFANITRGEMDFDDEAFDEISDDAKNFISRLLVKKIKGRMSAEECLKHPWLASAPTIQKRPLSTEKLKRFIIRRKWQKSGTAIRALGRMVSLSRSSLGSSCDSPLDSPTSSRSRSSLLSRSETGESGDSDTFQDPAR